MDPVRDLNIKKFAIKPYKISVFSTSYWCAGSFHLSIPIAIHFTCFMRNCTSSHTCLCCSAWPFQWYIPIFESGGTPLSGSSNSHIVINWTNVIDGIFQSFGSMWKPPLYVYYPGPLTQWIVCDCPPMVPLVGLSVHGLPPPFVLYHLSYLEPRWLKLRNNLLCMEVCPPPQALAHLTPFWGPAESLPWRSLLVLRLYVALKETQHTVRYQSAWGYFYSHSMGSLPLQVPSMIPYTVDIAAFAALYS